MSYSKSIAIVLTAFVCATAVAADAGAQSRGRSSGGRPSGGRGPTAGRTAPRPSGPVASPRVNSPRGITPGYRGRTPLRSYSYPYYYGYRPGFSIGFGYPYYFGSYGYPYYGAYGYPYGGYGSSYGGYYPNGYDGGGYGGGGYAVRGGAYGGVRIQGAPRQAEVFVDGYYSGIVDDYDGAFQRLDLQAGAHEIEIRTAGRPMTWDVNVTPGQTLTIHANVR